MNLGEMKPARKLIEHFGDAPRERARTVTSGKRDAEESPAARRSDFAVTGGRVGFQLTPKAQFLVALNAA